MRASVPVISVAAQTFILLILSAGFVIKNEYNKSFLFQEIGLIVFN